MVFAGWPEVAAETKKEIVMELLHSEFVATTVYRESCPVDVE